MEFPIEMFVQNPIVIHILVGIARAVLGYAENCAKVKKLLPFEFSKVIETIFRVGVQSFGLTAMGLPPGSAVVSDMGFSAIKKKKESAG